MARSMWAKWLLVLIVAPALLFMAACAGTATSGGPGGGGVTLTLLASAGTVHVTAEGPYGLGHPVATFTETEN